jgi:hypothetical protein
VTTEVGAALPDDVLKRYGLAGLRPAQRPDAVQFGLSLEPAGVGAGVLDVKVPAGQSRRVYATVRGASKLGDGEYQLLHVVERAGRQLLGGVSFIVTAHEKGSR